MSPINPTKYSILDSYRRAMGWSWQELPDRLGIRMNYVALYKAATGRNKTGPRPLYAAEIDTWIEHHRHQLEAALGKLPPW